MKTEAEIRRLLKQLEDPSFVPFFQGGLTMFDPRIESSWVDAKRKSPSRPPYTDVELADIRVLYNPNNRSAPSTEAVVIWTLLDMLEKERGWIT